jgi:hypothetical protein
MMHLYYSAPTQCLAGVGFLSLLSLGEGEKHQEHGRV